MKEYATAWRARNPEAYREWVADKRDKRSIDYKQWAEKNRDARREYMRAWQKENAASVAMRGSARGRKRPVYTPSWADKEKMIAFYEKARELRETTGQPYEVDHIVPLGSDFVSGLHCEANLQITLKAENLSKLNRRWPDMP
jgi:hypothetical protein